MDEIIDFRTVAETETPGFTSRMDLPNGLDEILSVSNICLQCGCITHDICKLHKYFEDYGAKANRYRISQRGAVRCITDHPHVIYEPVTLLSGHHSNQRQLQYDLDMPVYLSSIWLPAI